MPMTHLFKKLISVDALSQGLFVGMMLGLGLFVLSCENPEGALKPNTPPDTRIANVPANDTVALYLSQGAIPQQTLFWVGDDPDGFVIAFRYTWTDLYQGTVATNDTITLMNLATVGGLALDTLVLIPPITRDTPGAMFRIYNFLATLDPDDSETRESLVDSLATMRPFLVPYPSGFIATDWIAGADPLLNEAPTKGVFIFNSPADSNMHRFEVWSVDNLEVVDPTSAVVHFWTLPSPGLTVNIPTGPGLATSSFVLRYPTERTPGLLFGFGAIDPSTNERDYSWSVDDTLHWSEWDPTASTTVTGIHLQETGSDTHTIFLRGRNKWGVISPIASRDFRAEIPPLDDPNWPQKTLLINNTRVNSNSTWMPGVPADSVSDFYRDVFASIGKTEGVDYDIFVTSANSYAFPTLETMLQYTSIFLVAEQEISGAPFGELTRLGTKRTSVETYLNLGGKLIMSGPPQVNLLFSLAVADWAGFAEDFFKVLSDVSQPPFPITTNPEFDFVQGTGVLGYPNIAVDPAKLPAEADGAIKNIGVNFPRGFGQSIYEFGAKTDSVFFLNPLTAALTRFDGSPIGVRYLAPPPIPPGRQTFSSVYFGFPLYYMMKSDVIEVLRKAFEDINE